MYERSLMDSCVTYVHSNLNVLRQSLSMAEKLLIIIFTLKVSI